MDVRGRWALVTGGSRGMGAATVRELAARGAKVVFTWHTGEREAAELARALPAGAEPLALPCDVRRPGDIERVAAELRTRGVEIEVLVNNAGTPIRGSFEEATVEQWDEAFALHVRAPALFAKAIVPGMKTRGEGAEFIDIPYWPISLFVALCMLFGAVQLLLRLVQRARDALAAKGPR